MLIVPRLAFVLAGAAFLLGTATAAWGQDASVSAIDNEFDPAEIDVSAGTTVTWTNEGESPHTVTASDGSFDSGNLDPGDTFSHTFDQAGEFSYVCQYHEADGMVGAVTVTAEGGNGNGNGDGTGNGDDTEDPTDEADETDTGDETLPQTGADVGAFLYLALAFIGAGVLCLRLERSTT